MKYFKDETKYTDKVPGEKHRMYVVDPGSLQNIYNWFGEEEVPENKTCVWVNYSLLTDGEGVVWIEGDEEKRMYVCSELQLEYTDDYTKSKWNGRMEYFKEWVDRPNRDWKEVKTPTRKSSFDIYPAFMVETLIKHIAKGGK